MENIHLLRLCEDDPEFANKIVKEALTQPRRNYTGIPWTLLISRPLSTDLVGKMVTVQGAVIRVYEAFLRNVTSEQTCLECNTTSTFTESETRRRETKPFCDSCGSQHVKLNKKFQHSFSSQTIRIQDIGNSAAMAETIEILLEGEYVGKFAPGDKLRVTGAVARKWKPLRLNEPIVSTLYIRALSVICSQPLHSAAPETHPTLDGLTDGTEHSRRLFLVRSLCPQLVGLDHVKLGVLLALIGGNKGPTRSNIHLLMVGDPATGKTHLLRAAAELVAPSVLVNGSRTSDAGLTSCALRQGREWMIEAGALALSDRGVCCIDEFERLRVGEKSGLLEAMEQQTVSVAKAGIVTTLSTRCSVIGAMRFKNRRERGIEALGLNTPLVSRFDLIFSIPDLKEPGSDAERCKAVLSRDGSILKKKVPFWAPHMLKAYLTQIRSKEVSIVESHSEMLLKYYTKRRRDEGPSEYNTVRLLESLVRIMVAHAKLMDRDETEMDDVYVALILLECGVGSVGNFGFEQTKVFGDPDEFRKAMEKLNSVYEFG